MSNDFKSIHRHPIYYLSGGDLHLLAGSTLFRVHRYFFERESKEFRETLSRPASPGRGLQGNTDATALVLDVSTRELEKFCWVFYNPKYSLWNAELDDWTSILKLAHLWGFAEVQALAIQQMETMQLSVIDRIVLYQNFQVSNDILMPYYVDLCAREEFLDVEEGERLGMLTTVMVCRIRERLRCSLGIGLKCPLPADLDLRDIERTILEFLASQPGMQSHAQGATSGGLMQKVLRRRSRIAPTSVAASSPTVPAPAAAINSKPDPTAGVPDSGLVATTMIPGRSNGRDSGPPKPLTGSRKATVFATQNNGQVQKVCLTRLDTVFVDVHSGDEESDVFWDTEESL